MDSGEPTEEVYWAMLRLGHSMEKLDEPWPDVHDAYLRAWEFRPTRAEPLYALARRYANENRHQLGYLYARRAAEIPPPDNDITVPHPDIYTCATRSTDGTGCIWTTAGSFLPRII
jgi:hypothetical protein